MQTNDRFEDLMDYLTNRMSPDDRLAFEAELATNQALREALETERQLHNGLLAQAIRGQLTQVHDDLMDRGVISKPVPVRPLPVWWSKSAYIAVAASVVLIGGLAVYLFLPETVRPVVPVAIQSKPKPPVLVGPKPVIVKIPPAPPVHLPEKPVAVPKKALPQPEPPAELLAYNAFQQLTRSLPVEEQLSNEETATRGERTEAEELADGRLLLKQGTPAEAIKALKLLAESPSATEWPQWAQWYLAGAYLRAHQVNEAQRMLISINNNPAHPGQRAARKLLQKIN